MNACYDNNNLFYTLEECKVWNNGIATHGLQGVYKEWLNVARFKAADRQPDIDNPSQCSVRSIRSPDFTFLYDARWKYIAGAYDHIGDIHMADATTTINSFNSANLALCVSAMLSLPLVYFVIYAPLIRQLDREIKSTRQLLLLFPDEVSRTVSSIVSLGQDLAKAADNVRA